MALTRRKRVAAWSIAAAAYLVMAIVWSHPLYTHMFSGIPYEVQPQKGVELVTLSPQDCLQLYYKYWLFGESMSGRIRPFGDPYQFALPGAKGFTSQQIPVSILFTALKIINPIFAYNAVILLSFVAAGLAMMMLGSVLTGDRLAGFVAGAIFSLMPFRICQLMAGHPNGVVVFMLPLFLALAELGYRHNRLLYAVLAGLAYSSIAFSDMQVSFFSALLIALYLPLRILAMRLLSAGMQLNSLARRTMRWLAGMAIGAIPGLLYLGALKFLVIPESARHEGSSIRGIVGPKVEDLFNPEAGGEKRIYFGLCVALLALAGMIVPFLVRRLRRTRLQRSAPVLFWLAIVLIGICLSLSKYPPYSDIVSHTWIRKYCRTPARASVLTFTALSVLAAYGLSSIRHLFGKRKYGKQACGLIAGAGLLFMLHDYRPHGPIGINLLPVRSPIYERIVQERPDARVLAVMIWPGDSASSASLLYHITLSRAHIINGYSPLASRSYRDNVYRPLKMVNAGRFGRQEWEKCREFGITHLTFHPEAFLARWCFFPASFTLERLKQSPYLEWVEHDEPIDLFRIRDSPVVPEEKPHATNPIGISIQAVLGRGKGTLVEEDPASIMKYVVRGCGQRGTNTLLFKSEGRVYPSGSYNVALRFCTPSTAGMSSDVTPLLLKAVASESEARETLAELPLSAADLASDTGYRWATMQLVLPDPVRVTFEVWSASEIPVLLDLWHIVFADQKATMHFEAEDMLHVGRAIPDPEATTGRCVEANDLDSREFIVRGPYRFLPGGKYEMLIRLKATPLSSEAATVRFDLASRLSSITPPVENLTSQEWHPDPQDIGRFTTTRIPFDIPDAGSIVECCIHRGAHTAVAVDWLEIRPRL